MFGLVNGIATTLLTYGAHSAVACLLALAVSRRLRPPHERDVVWKATLIAPLLTTATTIYLSAIGRSGAFIDLAMTARRWLHVELPGREVIVHVLETSAGRDVTRQLFDPLADAMSIFAIVVALALVTVALIRFANRRLALYRALKGRRPLSEVLEIDQERAIMLSIAAELPSPVAFGAAQICLPERVMTEFDTRHRDALIAHELAHLERKDPKWFFTFELLCAISAFQPLVYVIQRAFRRDVELICDESALRRTNDRCALLGALALLASPFDARSPLMGAATAYDGSPLVMRAERIATIPLGMQVPRRWSTMILALCALIGVLLAVPIVSSAANLADLPIEPSRGAQQLRAHGHGVLIDSMVVMHRTRTIIRAE